MLVALFVALSTTASPSLYGMIRIKKGNATGCPSTAAPTGCSALVTVDITTGLIARVGNPARPPSTEVIAAVGDLSVTHNSVYYYLGDAVDQVTS